jgi:hypothetical protein
MTLTSYQGLPTFDLPPLTSRKNGGNLENAHLDGANGTQAGSLAPSICLASFPNRPRPRRRGRRRLGLLIAKKSTTKDEDEDEKD